MDNIINTSRRKFIKTCCATTCGALIHQTIFPTNKMLAYAFPHVAKAMLGSNKLLLVVNLAGGCSYNAVPPYNGKYYDLNPTLARKPEAPDAINLTSEQGLHPSLRDLKPLWDDGNLAIVNLVTFPNYTRAHDLDTDKWFSGMPTMQSGTQSPTGWAARLTCQMGTAFGGVSLAGANLLVEGNCNPPRTFANLSPSYTYNPGTNSLWTDAYISHVLQANPPLASNSGQYINEQMAALQETNTILRGPLGFDVTERYGVTFPNTVMGRAFSDVAKLLATPEIGTRFVFCQQPGYDTHQNERDTQAQNLTELNNALAALVTFAKLPAVNRWNDLIIVTMTEFGRTWENASMGTDHGHSNWQLVMGGSVNGGRLATPAPTAADCAANPSYLLASHVDNRQVFRECVRAMGLNVEQVFPGTSSSTDLGLFQT